MNKNDKLLYGLLGLLLGIVVTNVFSFANYNHYRQPNYGQMSKGVHQMPDGSVMSDDNDMGGMMDSMMRGLEGKTGDNFDKAFLSEMIVHHEGAVNMAKEVLAKSKRPELLKLANDIINAQTSEIQMMKDWQTSWFR